MNPREQLRRYLEQRRELGERELVLDSLSVDDVMRLVGAGPTRETPVRRERTPVADAPSPTRAAVDALGDTDWRTALTAVGANPSARPQPPTAEEPAAPPAAPPAPVPPPATAAAAHHEPPLAAEPLAAEPPAAEPPSGAAAPEPPRPAPRTATPARPLPPIVPGLIVGDVGRELFAGPLSRTQSIDELAALIAACTRCPLHRTATNPVPGEGSARAELVCVGEAPGATEDQTGRPFVGQAGQLLTKILEAINLRREDVFICNVLKHRPPGNRNPAPDEITACSPYLVRQLELIRPKVILALGTFAAQTLLETKLAIGKLRGQVHRYYGTPLIVTYHPAALLRNPGWKKDTWEDVKLARRILDRPTGA